MWASSLVYSAPLQMIVIMIITKFAIPGPVLSLKSPYIIYFLSFFFSVIYMNIEYSYGVKTPVKIIG